MRSTVFSRSTSTICSRCSAASIRPPTSSPGLRLFSQSVRRKAEDDQSTKEEAKSTQDPPGKRKRLSGLDALFAPQPPRSSTRPKFAGGLDSLARFLDRPQGNRSQAESQRSGAIFDYDLSASNSANSLAADQKPPHHFHIYATKHNTHITLTRPNRDAIISVAAGNLGFRKAARGSYDAAYQLAAYVMNRIQEQGLLREIMRLELVLRGFGAGREAVTKALMGSEGRRLRGKVIRVTDATRLKFGGSRSKKPRRLG